MTQIDETFSEFITEAASYEDVLTLQHRPRLANARNAFQYQFNCDPKFFNLLKDLQYYTGGYPSDDSPPKIDVLVEKIAAVAAWYHALGKLDELNEALEKQCGMVISPTPNVLDPTAAPSQQPERAEKYLNKIDPSGDWAQKAPGELAQFILDEGCEAQRDICYNADQIKITIGEQVEAQYDMKPSRFRDVVRVQSKLNLAKDPTKIIENNEEQEEQFEKVVQISTAVKDGFSGLTEVANDT